MSAAIVNVTFIDTDTGNTFLQLKLPARQLPDSFATATTLNLGKDDWQVVEASPATSAEFIARGALTLRLKKLQKIDPKDLLFSLPTIADPVPQPVPGDGEPLLKLHEDDWLQLELVPAEIEPRLESDLLAIRRVLEHERQGAGFKQLHIRNAVRVPFAFRELPLAALEQRFGRRWPLAWHSSPGLARHTFAFPLVKGALYGTVDGPRVAQLAVDRADADVRDFCLAERLLLVDWVRAAVTRW